MGIVPICVTVIADERLFTHTLAMPPLCPVEAIRATRMATKEELGLCLLMPLQHLSPQPSHTMGMIMHVNKVRHVKTIARVAEDLGEDEDWLRDVASEMEVEDGVIWVDGVGENGVQAFTDFGIENLIELVRLYKENPTWLKRRQPE